MAEEAIYLVRILYAVALGFAIGFERKLRFKEAGIRTHTIVCAGSALIMVVSKYAFSDSPDFDASRVAAQIVSGIGFLGAGNGENSGKVTEIFGVEHFSKLNAERKDGKVLCTGTVTTAKDVSATMIAELLTEHDFIRSIERCDDE